MELLWYSQENSVTFLNWFWFLNMEDEWAITPLPIYPEALSVGAVFLRLSGKEITGYIEDPKVNTVEAVWNPALFPVAASCLFLEVLSPCLLTKPAHAHLGMFLLWQWCVNSVRALGAFKNSYWWGREGVLGEILTVSTEDIYHTVKPEQRENLEQ